MSTKESNGFSKHCLVSKRDDITIYFYKGFDFRHGLGYFAHSVNKDHKIGFGFNNKSKITAVRQALIIK